MTTEEAKKLLEAMRRNNDRLLKQTQDVEQIAAFELLNSALAIAIEATEEGSDFVDLYEKATRKVLGNYLAPELVKKIIRETTLEYCRQVSKQ